MSAAATIPFPRDHNNPPEPTPFEVSRDRIADLYAEAKNWCDGEPIDSEDKAAEVRKLLDMLGEEIRTADARRKTENEPFDAGKAEVQARYNTLIGDTKSVKGKAILPGIRAWGMIVLGWSVVAGLSGRFTKRRYCHCCRFFFVPFPRRQRRRRRR